MRKHLAQDFDALYIFRFRWRYTRESKTFSTTHNVFGIQVGESVNLLVKKKAAIMMWEDDNGFENGTDSPTLSVPFSNRCRDKYQRARIYYSKQANIGVKNKNINSETKATLPLSNAGNYTDKKENWLTEG
jgi:hypothetical protein